MVPVERLALVIERAGGAMVMFRAFDAVLPAESVARTVNEKFAALVGDPARVPVEPRETPSGRLPDSTDQDYGGVPPDALTLAL
jgi:hypothetical protein